MAVKFPGDIFPGSWSQFLSPLLKKKKKLPDALLFTDGCYVFCLAVLFPSGQRLRLKNSHFERRGQKWRNRIAMYLAGPASLSIGPGSLTTDRTVVTT